MYVAFFIIYDRLFIYNCYTNKLPQYVYVQTNICNFFFISMLQFYRCWNPSSPSLFQTLRYPWEETSRCLVSSAIWEITKYLNLICDWFSFPVHVFSSLFIWHVNSSFNCWFLVRFLTSKRSHGFYCWLKCHERHWHIKNKK